MSTADQPFLGKTIVVTGASSGIGRAISIRLGALGATLVLIGRNAERLQQTANLAGPANCHQIQYDLNHLEGITPMIEGVTSSHGRLYGLCHAAGTVTTLPLPATSLEALQQMLQVNYLAGIELARVVCRRDVIESAGGAILFISAIYAHVGKPGQIAYSGSKGAVAAAARAMAIECARRKIRVNVLSPGMVQTEMTDAALAKLSPQQVKNLQDLHPLGFGSPEDVAHAAAFLLSPQAKWITGTDLVIDGGCSAQ